MVARSDDNVSSLASDVNMAPGRRPYLRRIRACEKNKVETVSCLSCECRRHGAVRRNQRFEFMTSFLSIDVENCQARAGGERDIGVRPAGPPAPDLHFVVGGVLEPAPGAGVLARARACRLAAAAGAVDDRVAREDSPMHPGVCKRGFELYVHAMAPCLIPSVMLERGPAVASPLVRGFGDDGPSFSPGGPFSVARAVKMLHIPLARQGKFADRTFFYFPVYFL